jgi:hypothetical protein
VAHCCIIYTGNTVIVGTIPGTLHGKLTGTCISNKIWTTILAYCHDDIFTYP